MKTNRFTFLVTLFFILMLGFHSFGQFEQKYTMQASLGLANPTGEMGDFFKTGISFDVGAQYNVSRSLSFVGLFKYVTLVPKEDFGFDVKFNSIGINICPKYKFMPESKFNPYILGGLGLCFSKYVFDADKYKFPTSFGFILGAGFDYSLSDNLGIFFQSGYSSYILKDSGYKSKLNSIFFQLGVNISFLKSKSL